MFNVNMFSVYNLVYLLKHLCFIYEIIVILENHWSMNLYQIKHGRGLKSGDNFDMPYTLADKLTHTYTPPTPPLQDGVRRAGTTLTYPTPWQTN